ncbi:MAG: hypothetical protein P8I93_01775 [Crocinitomicaceae bacterium]|nr:hypothetical protein [Crocinitomicaceae bacterium]
MKNNFCYRFVLSIIILSVYNVLTAQEKNSCECIEIAITKDARIAPKGCEWMESLSEEESNQHIEKMKKDCPEIYDMFKINTMFKGESKDKIVYIPKINVYDVFFDSLSIKWHHVEPSEEYNHDIEIYNAKDNSITIDLDFEDEPYGETLFIEKMNYDKVEIDACYKEVTAFYWGELAIIEGSEIYSEWAPIKVLENNKSFEISFDSSKDRPSTNDYSKTHPIAIDKLDLNQKKEFIRKWHSEWLYNEIKDCKKIEEMPFFERVVSMMILKIKLKKGNKETEKTINFYYRISC